MLREIPLFLSFLGGPMSARDCVGVLQVTALSPCSWDKIAVHIFLTMEGVCMVLSRTWDGFDRMPKAFCTTLLARESP